MIQAHKPASGKSNPPKNIERKRKAPADEATVLKRAKRNEQQVKQNVPTTTMVSTISAEVDTIQPYQES